MVTDMVTWGKIAVAASGSVPEESNKVIERYLNKAGSQICLSAKDGSL
jgi:hypothetical protein